MDNAASLGGFLRTHLKEKHVSENKAAQLAGIPRSTFLRKLEHPEQFTLDELVRISRVLDIKPSRLSNLHMKEAA